MVGQNHVVGEARTVSEDVAGEIGGMDRDPIAQLTAEVEPLGETLKDEEAGLEARVIRPQPPLAGTGRDIGAELERVKPIGLGDERVFSRTL